MLETNLVNDAVTSLRDSTWKEDPLSQETNSQDTPIIEPEYLEPSAAVTVQIVTEMDAKNALDALAWKIGQQAVLHLRQMYPDALKAVSSTCSMSLCNRVRNAVNEELWPLIRNVVAKTNSNVTKTRDSE